MKISKSILKNIAVGILVAGYIVSCEVEKPLELRHSENCKKDCKLEHNKPMPCYACGRG